MKHLECELDLVSKHQRPTLLMLLWVDRIKSLQLSVVADNRFYFVTPKSGHRTYRPAHWMCVCVCVCNAAAWRYLSLVILASMLTG